MGELCSRDLFVAMTLCAARLLGRLSGTCELVRFCFERSASWNMNEEKFQRILSSCSNLLLVVTAKLEKATIAAHCCFVSRLAGVKRTWRRRRASEFNNTVGSGALTIPPQTFVINNAT